MTDPLPRLDAALQARLDQHLDAIDRVLAGQGTPRAQRQTITSEVEAQVREMLAARARGKQTLAELDAVLAEVDPPEAYGSDRADRPLPDAASASSSSESTEPRLPTFVIAGAICAGIPLLTLAVRAFGNGRAISNGFWFMIFPAAMSTVLGLVSISEIRRSHGRLYGMRSAMAEALFYPLLLVDGLILYIIAHAPFAILHFFPSDMQWNKAILIVLGAFYILLGLFAVAMLDSWIIRRIWRAINRPLLNAGRVIA